jgi:hypothetical protein
MNTKDILIQAKNEILVHGWIQRDYGDQDQGFCILGALGAVQEKNMDTVTYSDIATAYEELSRQLVRQGCIGSTAAWNDAPHRKEQEVLDLFDNTVSNFHNAEK